MRQLLTKRSLLSVGGIAALAGGLFYLAPPGQAAADSPSPIEDRREVTPETEAAGASRALPVQTVQAEAVDGWQQAMRFTGTLAARRESALGFERDGLLTAVLVEEGQQVERGEVVAQLDTARLELQLAQLNAELRQQQAMLDELLAGPRSYRLEVARAAIRELQARLQRIERESKRRQELLADGFSATEEAEALATEGIAMQARLEGARQTLAELEEGTRPEQIAAQKARVELAQARVDALQLDVDRSQLRAPFDGIVLARHADEGRFMGAGIEVLHVQESHKLEARIGVPIDLKQLPAVGDSVELLSLQDTVSATLRAQLPDVDAATRTRTLLFDLDAGSHALPGSTVAWQVHEFRKGQGHQIPSTALTPGRRGLWAVMLVVETEDGLSTVQRQEVQVLHTATDTVVVSGLRDDDVILAAATERVVPGQAVRSQAAEPLDIEE